MLSSSSLTASGLPPRRRTVVEAARVALPCALVPPAVKVDHNINRFLPLGSLRPFFFAFNASSCKIDQQIIKQHNLHPDLGVDRDREERDKRGVEQERG